MEVNLRRWGVAWLATPSVAVRWHSASETHRFKAGTLDLEETARLLERLFSEEGRAWTDARRLRGQAHRRLSRAYLNRAYDARRGGDPALAWNCLRRAVAFWPGIVGSILRDPRMAARMATLPFTRLTVGSPPL